MLHLHRWSKWVAHDHFIDTSWDGEAESTTIIRECRCGMVQSKGLYGVTLPLPTSGASNDLIEDAEDEARS
jgi:hypothetical protein